MSATASGNMREGLTDLIKRLKQLPAAVDRATRDVRKTVDHLLIEEWMSSKDAYGRRWMTARSDPSSNERTKAGRPKRTIPGKPTDLVDTGAMARSFRVTASRGQVRVLASPLARLYQYAWGTATFLPWHGQWQGKVSPWIASIEQAARKAVEEHLLGR